MVVVTGDVTGAAVRGLPGVCEKVSQIDGPDRPRGRALDLARRRRATESETPGNARVMADPGSLRMVPLIFTGRSPRGDTLEYSTFLRQE